MSNANLDIVEFVSKLEDPRSRDCPHNFSEIVITTICAAVCGMLEWDEIVFFATENKDWLKEKLKIDFSNGIPSHFTFARVISSIEPTAFSKIFTAWIQAAYPPKENQVIAIDGKSLRGSYPETKGADLTHIVNAMACDTGITLAQLEVQDKENEITAIPKLLEYLDIRKSIITMDAMGSQKSIAKVIRDYKGDYIFAIKANRKHLFQSLKLRFEEVRNDQTKSQFKQKEFVTRSENQHGRVEERTCLVIPVSQLSADQENEIAQWQDVKTAVEITYTHTHKKTGEVKNETRFFITSLKSDAERIAQSIREHWYIENKLHWVLDVVYKEDDSRMRINFAPHNASAIKKIALNLLRIDKTYNKSMKLKQKKALVNKGFLEQILGIKDA
ncbi:MAG: ISAs1 family transposase [Candidatus Melainabacteria bacterium]|jgi:predicted transposase YbfD/YdcC|nr:ISAs1 family transposase [Candidatus Melainabacteria bacterium]